MTESQGGARAQAWHDHPSSWRTLLRLGETARPAERPVSGMEWGWLACTPTAAATTSQTQSSPLGGEGDFRDTPIPVKTILGRLHV